MSRRYTLEEINQAIDLTILSFVSDGAHSVEIRDLIVQLLDDRQKLLDRAYEYRTHLEIDGELPTALERVNRTIKEVTGDE